MDVLVTLWPGFRHRSYRLERAAHWRQLENEGKCAWEPCPLWIRSCMKHSPLEPRTRCIPAPVLKGSVCESDTIWIDLRGVALGLKTGASSRTRSVAAMISPTRTGGCTIRGFILINLSLTLTPVFLQQGLLSGLRTLELLDNLLTCALILSRLTLGWQTHTQVVMRAGVAHRASVGLCTSGRCPCCRRLLR